MKKKIRKIVWFGMMISLISCGGGGAGTSGTSGTEGDNVPPVTEEVTGGIDKNRVYREEELKLEGLEFPAEDLSGRLYFIDGEVRAFGMHYDFTLPEEEGEEGGETDTAPAPEPREEDESQMHAAGGDASSGTGETDEPQMHTAGGEKSDTGEETPAEPEEPEMYPGMVEGMTNTTTVFTLRFAPDAARAETIVLDRITEGGIWYGSMVPGEDGSTYALKTIAAGDLMPAAPAPFQLQEATEEEENAEDGTEEDRVITDTLSPDSDVTQGERYLLVKFDAKGKVVWETELQDEDAEWYSVGAILYVGGHGVYVSDTRGVSLYTGEDGRFIETVYASEEWTDMVMSGDGRVYVRAYQDDTEHLIRVDRNAGDNPEDIAVAPAISSIFNLYNLQPAFDGNFLLSDNTGVYTWDLKSEEPEQLFGFIDSDLNIDSLESMVQVSEEELIAFYYAGEDGGNSYRLARLKKVPPGEVPDKQVLTLGCFWLDSEVRSAVFAFNKENRDCRIQVKEYSREASDGSYDQALVQMNADIVSGEAPDIMILADEAQIESYEAKGVFEPLDAYIENDPDIEMKDYMTNVFDAYRYKGEMYLLVPAFTLRTYAMKQSDAESVTGWTFREMERIAQERGIPAQTMFGYPITNMNLVFQALVFDGASYIDWNEQKAKFDSQQFIDLLDVAKKFPSEEEIDDSWWDQDQDALYRNGQALIAQTFMGSFKAYTQLKYGTFGEEVAFVGFPREEGEGGHTIMATARIAMNAESENKDGCWAFMRTFLMDEYQERFISGWAFPVSKSKLQEKADKSMERDSYVDALTGETVYFDETYYVGGEEITIPPLTKEEADMLMDFLEGVDVAYSYNETIMNIVQEEVKPFFAGQKSAQECARILQSRLQLYMDENS
ncbi:MAG: extracellular solute-binding protein [Lachnospiraceae bacterium]|nr:extracellular solute-binding protein [Lachnospiraceae bacterium]